MLVVVSSRWWQSSALGQRNGLIRRSSVVLSRISRTNVLAASRRWVLLTVVEESGSAVISVKGRLSAEEARSTRRRFAARIISLSFSL